MPSAGHSRLTSRSTVVAVTASSDAEAFLVSEWQRLTAAVGAPTDAIHGLLSRHREPQRHYHTAQHVQAVLSHLDVLDPSADPALRLAAFYHDAVYDSPLPPGSESNEERSAQLAEQELADCDAELVERVASLIRVTDGHRLVPLDGAAEFLDADLSILGAEPRVYDRYAEQIRKEYALVTDADYRVGRSLVLRQFFERDSLFFTPAGQSLWEAAARRNLARELHALGHPPGRNPTDASSASDVVDEPRTT